MRKLSAVLAVLVLAQSVGAQQKEPEKKPEEGGTMRIDFAPLAGADKDGYEVPVRVTTVKGTFHKDGVVTNGRPAPTEMASLFKDSLAAGWDATLDGTKVTIRSYKGDPVKSIEVSVVGLDPKCTPIVVRLDKE